MTNKKTIHIKALRVSVVS